MGGGATMRVPNRSGGGGAIPVQTRHLLCTALLSQLRAYQYPSSRSSVQYPSSPCAGSLGAHLANDEFAAPPGADGKVSP